MNRFLIFLIVMLFSVLKLSAQEAEGKTGLSLGADFISRWVWSGTDYGRSPSIKPYLSVRTGRIECDTWGTFSTNGLNIRSVNSFGYLIYAQQLYEKAMIEEINKGTIS